MPRPVRELWNGLGASPGEGDDLVVVDAHALALESVFGGSLASEVTVRLFSDEAFGFSAPEELAALGVFWAPHLETSEQLRAAVTDAQDRLRRKLDDDNALLARLGFHAELRAPLASSRGWADIGGQHLEVAVGPAGELLLERVEGGEVPAERQEILRDASSTSRQAAQDLVVERAHALLEEGVVEPAAVEPSAQPNGAEHGDGDSAGFEEDNATRQLAAAALNDDPGTELVPPPSEDDELSEAERAELAEALQGGDLLGDSLEGPALDDDSAGDELPPAGADEALADDDADEVATHEIAGTTGSTAADIDEGFVRPKTAPTFASDTKAPDSFDDFPAMVTEQMSVVPPIVAESVSSPGGDDDGFNPDTGEEVLLSLSGEDGVMPSPAEATALRPAPTASELSLDEQEPSPAQPSAADAALPPAKIDDDDQEDATVTAATLPQRSADDDERTLAKAPVFSGRKGPSLVSSGSAGSSIDDIREHRELGEADADEGLGHESAPVRDGGEHALRRLEAEPTDPSLGVIAQEQAVGSQPSLDLDVEVPASSGDVVAADDEADGERDYATGKVSRGLRESAAATALASLVDDHAEEQTQAEAPRARSDDRLGALAAIVGEGMSSGKTGAIVLDADAFAYLREQAGEAGVAGDDPDALEREAEQLESRARELRAQAELLRERATAPVSRRKLASALEKARARRDDDELAAAESSRGDVSARSERGAAFRSEEPAPSDDAFASHEQPADDAHDDESASEGSEADAFADGVALEDVRAMLAAERASGSPDLYAATQLAEMDLGDLRPASNSDGGVFDDGAHDEPAFELEDATNRARAYHTSMGSLPQVASADVHALPSRVESQREPSADVQGGLAAGVLESDEEAPTQAMPMPALRPPPEASAAKAPAVARALALVVSDPRARERLKKHLEETFPRVVELASAREAATLSASEVQAVVIVRPVHDDATVSGLEELDGNDSRPPVLLLSSDESFDGLPGVDLRIALGRRASEVARQVLDGLTTLGVQASA